MRARTEQRQDVGVAHDAARAADDAAAGRNDQGSVAELGFEAGGRATPAGVPDPELPLPGKRRKLERSEAELAKMKRVVESQGTSQRCWRRCSVPRARRGMIAARSKS